MKRKILLFWVAIQTTCLFSQDIEKNIESEDSMEYMTPLELYYEYNTASPERKIEIDSLMSNYENYFKPQQVKSICGVDFGTQYEKALPILKNKFGDPSDRSDSNTIHFDKINYAGFNFDGVYFDFQSDGYRSYFNSCIFIKSFADKKDAEDFLLNIKHELRKKYRLAEEELVDYGVYTKEDISESLVKNPYFSCGVSPVWDGNWKSMLKNAFSFERYTSAISDDIVEYDDRVVKAMGIRYAARLIYGPYHYVKEEF